MLRRISNFIGDNCATIKTGFMEGYHKGLHREALASQERGSNSNEEPLEDDSPGLCDA